LRKFARRNKRALAGAAVLAAAVLVVAGTLGWAVRDRESRAQAAARDRAEQQEKMAARVGQALDESENQYRRRKLPEAVQLARNALALADGGAGGPEVERRAREWLNDLNMVARLEEIHAPNDVEWKVKLGEFLKAFREFGIDVEGLPPEEAAARIAARPVCVDLAVALDWCARDLSHLDREKREALRARLRTVARLADPDLTRNRVRLAYSDEMTDEQREQIIRELAASVDLATTPIVTLMMIGNALPLAEQAQGQVQRSRERIAFYTRLHQQHPGDFYVTYRLAFEHLSFARFALSGNTTQEDRDAELDRAITYLTAAKAMRPTNLYIRKELGRALAEKGRVDEALAELREYERLKPGETLVHRWHIANALMKKKDRQEEALAIYRELVRADPNNYGYHSSFGEALRDLGRTDASIVEFREAIRISPNSGTDYNLLGLALVDKGSWDEAITAHREAIRLGPHSWEFRFNLGLVLTKKSLWEEAIAACREAIRLNPKATKAHSSLGNTLVWAKRYDEAIVAFQEAVRLDPKDTYAQDGLGLACFERGRWDEAIAAYQACVRLDPDNADRQADLAHAFLRKGSLDEANGTAREAIRLQPNGFRGHHFLASALLKQRRTDEAIASFREAVRLQKNSSHAHEGLAEALRQKGQLDEAIACYKKVIEIDPKFTLAHNNLAVLLGKQGNTDEAVACYRKAIEVAPNNAIFHYNLGFALQKLGKLDEAIAEYREAIRLKPDDADARRDLDSALSARRTINEATKAIELKPTDWSSWNQRAWAYFQQKQWDRAIADYSKAIELNSNVHTTWFHRGHAYMDLKKWDKAIVDYSELLRRFPDDSNARFDRGLVHENLGHWDQAIADYSKAIKLAPPHDLANRRLSWLLATSPDVKLRDADRAVELAKQGVLRAPKQYRWWLTLGVAYYRVRDWKAAAETLDLSMVLRNGGDSNEWFFLAMTHWQQGNKADARKWYDKGVEWMDKNQPENKELRRFRDEARELLRVAVEVGPAPREKK
jgi:tetratricopeptide (TPR) repeat protein